MNVIRSTTSVTTRPRARSTPAMPPAWSMCAITQPPKISPLALVSAGIAMVRTVSSPRGAAVLDSSLRGVAPDIVSPIRQRSDGGEFDREQDGVNQAAAPRDEYASNPPRRVALPRGCRLLNAPNTQETIMPNVARRGLLIAALLAASAAPVIAQNRDTSL